LKKQRTPNPKPPQAAALQAAAEHAAALQAQLGEATSAMEALRGAAAQSKLQAAAAGRELCSARELVAEYKSLAGQRERQVAQLRAEVCAPGCTRPPPPPRPCAPPAPKHPLWPRPQARAPAARCSCQRPAPSLGSGRRAEAGAEAPPRAWVRRRWRRRGRACGSRLSSSWLRWRSGCGSATCSASLWTSRWGGGKGRGGGRGAGCGAPGLRVGRCWAAGSAGGAGRAPPIHQAPARLLERCGGGAGLSPTASSWGRAG
jgi:hypothetical protein